MESLGIVDTTSTRNPRDHWDHFTEHFWIINFWYYEYQRSTRPPRESLL